MLIQACPISGENTCNMPTASLSSSLKLNTQPIAIYNLQMDIKIRLDIALNDLSMAVDRKKLNVANRLTSANLPYSGHVSCAVNNVDKNIQFANPEIKHAVEQSLKLIQHQRWPKSTDCNIYAGLLQRINVLSAEYDQGFMMYLKKGKVDVNRRLYQGNTLLHFAIKSGVLRNAYSLLDLGANVDIKNDNCEAPLMLAVLANDKKLFDRMMNNTKNIEVIDRECNSLLILAVKQNNYGMVKKIINFHKSSEPAIPERIQSIRTASMRKGVNIEARDNQGYTALQWAVAGNRIKIVKLLIKNNADVSVVDAAGDTLLRIAMDKDFFAIVKMLSAS